MNSTILTLIKIAIIIVIIVLMAAPLIPFSDKTKIKNYPKALRFGYPYNTRNAPFIFLGIIEAVALALLMTVIKELVDLLLNVPFISNLISQAALNQTTTFDFVSTIILTILVNLIIIYVFFIIKTPLKVAITKAFAARDNKKEEQFPHEEPKKKEEKQEDSSEDSTEDDKSNNSTDDLTDNNENNLTPVNDELVDENSTEENFDSTKVEDEVELKKKKRKRVPFFRFKYDKIVEKGFEIHDQVKKSIDDIADDYQIQPNFVKRIFFEDAKCQFGKPWVVLGESILSSFIKVLKVLYLFLFGILLFSIFFQAPTWMYTFLVDFLKFQDWYLYPFVSLIILQEVCNTLYSNVLKQEFKAKEEIKEKQVDEETITHLIELQDELVKEYDKEHCLRIFPANTANDDEQEIVPYALTNKTYGVVLEHIENIMKDQSGRVVQSYMRCLDSIFNDNNVYFCSSMFSEFGEYLIAYTYARLLSGARLMFVVSDIKRVEGLRQYISKRLIKLTDTEEGSSWRVYTAKDRLDQADVFVASPDDFKTENIVEHYPGFFEEVSNAIFIDADRLVTLDSYLCLVTATRLNNATHNRLRYIFLTSEMIKGFAHSTLPRFFDVEKVLFFSNADEYERVDYVLWNRESKNNRIYNKHGQTLTSLDCLIAEKASEKRFGIDGVRLLTDAPMEHADIDDLINHNVEVNEFHKDMPDVNYMIYSDDKFNLASSLYACTRFRGVKYSYANIISKPYLLREYFMSKASSENFIKRSSFIQPRVVEHAEHYKLILLEIFAKASNQEGMPVSEFKIRMQNVVNSIFLSKESENILSARCAKLIKALEDKEIELDDITIPQYVEFIISALCDNYDTTYENSEAADVKQYYLVINPDRFDAYTLQKEKSIVFKHCDQVYEKLFKCNERVKLSLNGKIIGMLDTFPSRVIHEYVPGQCFVYNNTEYEIERISRDKTILFLRRENVRFKNTMDTIFLRRFDVVPLRMIKNDDDIVHQFNELPIKKYDQSGDLTFSKGPIARIRVEPYKAAIYRETYGFYSLTSDHQTLNFEKGVIGSMSLDNPIYCKYNESKILKVSIKSRDLVITDGTRLLLSTVLNEFIKTIFPNAYHCVAIAPLLEEPIDPTISLDNFDNQVKTLYPYLFDHGLHSEQYLPKDRNNSEFIENYKTDYIETDSNTASFYFINDCIEDIGALDWFYDKLGHYVHEFLANVYSYLSWLNNAKDFTNHYIYFGGEALPAVYDLNNACELLKDCNLTLNDSGMEDYDTAKDASIEEEIEFCSFCHKPMESGRYQSYGAHRYICTDCMSIVNSQAELDETVKEMVIYLHEKYPGEEFGRNVVFKLVKPFDLQSNQTLTEYSYELDYDRRVVNIEMIPFTNAKMCIIHALVTFWQRDNQLNTPFSKAQCYFEEMKYLNESHPKWVEWLNTNLDEETLADIATINEYIGTEDGSKVTKTSFTFMRTYTTVPDDEDDTDYSKDNEYNNFLYEPGKMPRFWKRYLRGEKIDDGEEENLGDDFALPVEDDETNDSTDESEEN